MSMIKLAVVGSRDISNLELVQEAYNKLPTEYIVTEIVSGGARGVDQCAERLAEFEQIKLTVFEVTAALAKLHGTIGALFARNQQIVNYCDALIAIRLPGKSSGTDDVVARMAASGKPYWVYTVKLTPYEQV